MIKYKYLIVGVIIVVFIIDIVYKQQKTKEYITGLQVTYPKLLYSDSLCSYVKVKQITDTKFALSSSRYMAFLRFADSSKFRIVTESKFNKSGVDFFDVIGINTKIIKKVNNDTVFVSNGKKYEFILKN
ncbi:MAG: hypothetical protein ACJAQR_001126 [Bacteroidia bacterium]|jgi:hypothetical protein|tara:strand:- start:86 stop:472 length:387 start_codon:yes stop_codon:yes gene_type:complete